MQRRTGAASLTEVTDYEERGERLVFETGNTLRVTYHPCRMEFIERAFMGFSVRILNQSDAAIWLTDLFMQAEGGDLTAPNFIATKLEPDDFREFWIRVAEIGSGDELPDNPAIYVTTACGSKIQAERLPDDFLPKGASQRVHLR